MSFWRTEDPPPSGLLGWDLGIGGEMTLFGGGAGVALLWAGAPLWTIIGAVSGTVITMRNMYDSIINAWQARNPPKVERVLSPSNLVICAVVTAVAVYAIQNSNFNSHRIVHIEGE